MGGSNVEFAERFDRLSSIFRGWQEFKHYTISVTDDLHLNFVGNQVCSVMNRNDKCEFMVAQKLVLPQRTGVFMLKRGNSDEIDFLIFDNYLNVIGEDLASAKYTKKEASGNGGLLAISGSAGKKSTFNAQSITTKYGQMLMPPDSMPTNVFDLPTICHDPAKVNVQTNDDPKSNFEYLIAQRISTNKGAISYPSYASAPKPESSQITSASSSSSSSAASNRKRLAPLLMNNVQPPAPAKTPSPTFVAPAPPPFPQPKRSRSNSVTIAPASSTTNSPTEDKQELSFRSQSPTMSSQPETAAAAATTGPSYGLTQLYQMPMQTNTGTISPTMSYQQLSQLPLAAPLKPPSPL